MRSVWSIGASRDQAMNTMTYRGYAARIEYSDEDDYLETCVQLGRAPQKSYSGKLMLRVPPEVLAAVAAAAEVSGKSINQWAAETFTKAVQAS